MALHPRPTLRERMRSRYHRTSQTRLPLDLPPTGHIPQHQLRQIQELASHAFAGNDECRDLLYFSLQPRLVRIGNILKPWPNDQDIIGIWDHGDVEQEGYLVFIELLAAWDGTLPFVPYLLSRFAWRLREKILRGIGKPRAPRGMISVSDLSLFELVLESDQPEQAAIAREMLQHMVLELADRMELQGESESIIQLIAVMHWLRPDCDPASDHHGKDAA